MKTERILCVAGMVLAALSAPGAEPAFSWGGREAHPAVVNPVLGSEPGSVLSLRGDWTFTTEARNVPVRNGIWGHMFQKEWKQARTVAVPGCWEAQGVGEPGDGECWDATWDNNAKPIRHKYMGEGWYRRTVEIPANWKDHRIWIKFGGVKAIGWVWVNGRQVAEIHNYCGTEKYEITDLVEPGKSATVVVDVDNRKPSRKGLMSAMHKWGGIYRDVELEATPRTFIDDAWFRGDFDRQEAEAHVDVSGLKNEGVEHCSVRVTVEGQTVERSFGQSDIQTSEHSGKGIEHVVRLPLKNFRAWSPERPNLYTGLVELVVDGAVVQTRRERFGVRKIEVRGREFFLNGRPFYIRGFGDDHVYPLTGLTPADRDVHRTHLAKARAAGFNFVRLHTHCEVPEYFEAADELGILIQPELPYYSDVATEGFSFDPKRDVTELWRNYRRHPSFAVYSMGNEGSFGDSLDRALHAYVKAMDPDRLKINQDCHVPAITAADRADFAGGPTRPWPRGSFASDRPFVTHEYLNLCVKSDSRDEARYTGVWMPPATRTARAKWLSQFGLGHDWGDWLQDAQHVLQGVWQKEGIESARLDPLCGGYIFWTIVDVVVWNDNVQWNSAQGLLDPFWGEKRHGTSIRDFSAFNSPSCVLADISPTNSVFVSGGHLRTDLFLAHYGEVAQAGPTADWRLVAGGRALASGKLPVGEQKAGALRRIGLLDLDVPSVEQPQRASLEVSVGDIRNAWDVWIFPKGPSLAEIRARAARAGVVIAAAESDEAKKALAAGRPLVAVDGIQGPTNVRLGWWWMGSQVGTAIRRHPAWGKLPHVGALDPMLFRIVKTGRELPVAGVTPEEMIMVGEGGQKCYLYLSSRKVGASRVLACHGLDVLCNLPEANAILDAFVDWLSTDGKNN